MRLQVDTARVYAGGTSEEYLGQIGWKEKGLKLETKLYPTATTVRFKGSTSIHSLVYSSARTLSLINPSLIHRRWHPSISAYRHVLTTV